MAKKRAKRKTKRKSSKQKDKAKETKKEINIEKLMTTPKKLLHKKINWSYIIGGVLLIAVIIVIIANLGELPSVPTQYDEEYGSVKLDFYVMSQCPYGTQVEDAIAPVLAELGDSIDFNLNFIATETAPGEFRALHGQPEVEGNIVQLCAAKYNPDTYMDMIVCMNENARSIPGNWKGCAEKNGLDVANIETCYTGQEGIDLHSENIKLAQQVNARGSPTIYVNDVLYQGGRSSTDFKKALCVNLDNHPGCEGLPACTADQECVAESDKVGICENAGTKEASCSYIEPVEVEVIILNDMSCNSCDATQVQAVTQQLFKGAVFEEIDVSSPEGKLLIEKHDLVYAPAFIFDENLVETYGWEKEPRMHGAFDQIDGGYKLKDQAIGASHFIDEEKRDAYMDMIGVTLGDNRPQVDFYVMSYCPWGNKAEEALKEVYDVMKDDADFIPHYVIYSDYTKAGPCFDEENKYCSLHGLVELNQDLREMCVYQHMGIDDWFDFAIEMNSACNQQNADTCWEGVADELGLDKEVINTCFNGEEGLALLEADRELNQILGVTGSPTLFFDGERYTGQGSPTWYQASLCNTFDDQPAVCDNLIAETASAPATPGAAGCGPV